MEDTYLSNYLVQSHILYSGGVLGYGPSASSLTHIATGI